MAMKQCPFCKAELQENARFCLYCMHSLEDKQPAEEAREHDRRWIAMIAVPLAAIILAVGVWALVRQSPNHTSTDSDISTGGDDTSDTPNGSSTASTTKTTSPHGTDTVTTTSGNNSLTGKLTTNTNTTRAAGTPSSGSRSSAPSSSTADTTHVNGTTPSKGTASSPKNTSSEKTASSAASTVTAPSTTDVTYLYRDARYGDDFSVHAVLDNAVVITGVSTPSADGTYVIPATLGGKTVVAIMGLAFSADNVCNTVKQVVVPAGVKTIWNYAFAKCGQMTDIYFCGNAIYTEALAFADMADRVGTLTIHCSASCNDRNFRYYKNNASAYDALYEEWNG